MTELSELYFTPNSHRYSGRDVRHYDNEFEIEDTSPGIAPEERR